MRDLKRTTDFGIGAGHAPDDIGERAAGIDRITEIVPILEETLRVSKRQVVSGRVRVSTRTETYDAVAETTLDRNMVDVTRVPIGDFVDVAPKMRTEGDVTIVPVVEERLVVTKRLFLVEELHISHRLEQDVVRDTVPLRRQNVIIERLDADGGDLDALPNDE